MHKRRRNTMRIPTDISLASYIRQLIREDKLYKFYKSDEWRKLRERVLEDNHYECQQCIRKGRYTKAATVHHINEVRKRPDLALSRTYRDQDGVHDNLMPLCNACHNKEHKKLEKYIEEQHKDNFTNEERW